MARSRVREEGVGKSVGDFIMVVCAESFDVFIGTPRGKVEVVINLIKAGEVAKSQEVGVHYFLFAKVMLVLAISKFKNLADLHI